MTSSRGPASGTSTIMTAAVGTTPPSPPKPAAVCTGGLMPPELLDVLAACPHTRTWKTPGRTAEPDLAGLRDRALLLVGFFAALRRSELAALTVDQVSEHPNGLVLTLPRSKTNQHGIHAELVVLPAPGIPPAARSPRCAPGSMPPESARVRCCARSARATDQSPATCTPSRSTSPIQAAVARAARSRSRSPGASIAHTPHGISTFRSQALIYPRSASNCTGDRLGLSGDR